MLNCSSIPLGVVEGGFVGDRTEAQSSNDAESRIGKGVKHSQSPPQQPGLVVASGGIGKDGLRNYLTGMEEENGASEVNGVRPGTARTMVRVRFVNGVERVLLF